MWKGWKKRYIVIKDLFLTYKEEPDKAVKGTISLQNGIIKISTFWGKTLVGIHDI